MLPLTAAQLQCWALILSGYNIRSILSLQSLMPMLIDYLAYPLMLPHLMRQIVPVTVKQFQQVTQQDSQLDQVFRYNPE